MIGVHFSIVAAAALRLSMNLCQPDLEWDNQLSYWSGFAEEDIEETVGTLSKVKSQTRQSLIK